MVDFSQYYADYSATGCVASPDHDCCAFCRNRERWLAFQPSPSDQLTLLVLP